MTVRRLYVLRHAAAAWPAPAQGDYARRLDRSGLGEAQALAQLLADRAIVFDTAVSSGAARTRQTLSALGSDRVQGDAVFDDSLYHGSASAYREAAARFPRSRGLVIVGHNPGIGDFVRETAQGGTSEALRRLTLGFPTCALAILRFENDAPTFLEELVLPLEDSPVAFRTEHAAPISSSP